MTKNSDSERLNIMANFDIKLDILTSAERLLADAPIRSIKVVDICKEAGISHATFYRYFKDKYAIAQWHMRYAQMQGVDKIGRTLNWHDGYLITEQLMLDHVHFYEGASRSDDYNGVDSYSSRTRRTVLRDTLVNYKNVELTDALKFQIDATVDMEVRAFPRWQDGEYDVSLEEMIGWIVGAIPRELFELLNEPTMPRSANAFAGRNRPDDIWRPHSEF